MRIQDKEHFFLTVAIWIIMLIEFQDASLMIYRKGQLYALLPANRLGDTLYSHQGLTYGGLITKEAVHYGRDLRVS